MSGFVHLHVHSEYSLLDGLSSCKALAEYAVELGMSALAITDHGTMYGVVDFYKACRAAGIKPIIGIEAYVARTSRHSRDRNDGKPYHIILLAQNQTGYQNLIKLASIAQLEGFYYVPRLDKEVLARHSEGIIVLTACAGGEIPRLLYDGQEAKAREAIRWYQEHFPGRFYIELQNHNIPEFEPVYRQVVGLAREMNVPLVATNDIHYTRREQAEAHDVLLCIGTSKTVNEPNRMRMSDSSYYMRSPDEMWQLYGHVPDALENTLEIAEQCQVELQFAPPYHLPKFPVPQGHGTSEEYLRYLCYTGLVWRYGEERAQEAAVVNRLEYELGIIHSMGFDDYFLIVWDLCEAAKARDIWWNVRGSGAGSVVAYTLGVTNIDPFKNRLMFERFLNPNRVSMPDIDLDYPDDRRDELIQYTVERYGADHVTQIITFGTLGARAAVRDVGRALDVPLSEVDRVARLIPNQPGKPITIAQALEMESELKEIYDTTPYIKKLIDAAMQVEGVARHASTHAAGVLVSDLPLVEYLPLARPTKMADEKSTLTSVSQWPMDIVDAMGMLKVDFLGLRTLTQMRKTCELIEQRCGRKLDLNTIPYERAPDDPGKDADVKALYDLLASGDTTGIFQVEGGGMRRTLRELRPSQFQHIVAVLALYRPGPLEHIPTYIRRMHGEEEVKYHHPVLEDILGDTYGICVSGDTIVTDVKTGQRLRIDQVGEQQDVYLQGIDDQWHTAVGRVIRWVHNGRKPVLKVTLRTGAYIKATADHRFLTEDGWKPLSDLKVGDYVATPSELVTQEGAFDQCKLRVLAYLLADGDLSNLAAVNFVSQDSTLIGEYEACLAAFDNVTARRIEQVRDVTRVTVAKSERDNYHAPNELLAWLRELGLKYPAGSKPGGARAAEKFVPEFIFGLRREQIAFFLASLWDCDGYIGPKLGHYKTISFELAQDVQMLLLKLGIPSRIYSTDYESGRGQRTSYQVTVYETARLAEWLRPYLLTPKRDVPATACAGTTIARAPFVTEVEAATTLSKRALMRRYGIDRQHFSPRGKRRARIHAAIVVPLLSQLSLPGTEKKLRLVWEEIVGLESAGVEDVYDITVEGLHNFVANNIIVHNCVYQEQIMQIAVAMAGYEPGEADMIRKAVAKKIKRLMEMHKKTFREGALKKGISAEVTDAVWGDIEFFARYGFNRAHATDYAVITAQTAYLKAHYPMEFMTGLMTTERHNTEKIGFLIAECRRMGIEVLSPDVNQSGIDFSIKDRKDGASAIRFGLGAVKNVGEGPVEIILAARESGGPFRDLDDLCRRVDMRKVNRRALESLIKVGALSAFGTRAQLLSIVENLIGVSANHHRAREVGQMSLFGEATGVRLDAKSSLLPALSAASEVPQKEILAWEKELVGVYISEHPLTQAMIGLQDVVTAYAGALSSDMNGQQVTVAGMVQRVRRHTTKKGDEMAFVTLEDFQGDCDLIVFPRVWSDTKHLWQPERILVINAKVDAGRRDAPSLLCNWAKTLDEMAVPSDSGERRTTSVRQELPAVTRMTVPSVSPPVHTVRVTLMRSGKQSQDVQRLRELHSLLVEYSGQDQFVIRLTGGASKPVELAFPNDTTRYNPELERKLAALVGREAIQVERR
jgi:DNA polymerase-3 subunit alpha